jgi:hypothetical protein
VLGNLLNDIRHGIRERGLRGRDSETLGEQLAGFHVHGSPFDACSADIDAERSHGEECNLKWEIQNGKNIATFHSAPG